MQLPNSESSPDRIVLYGRYLRRATMRAAYADLALMVLEANDAVVAADRQLFDLAGHVEEATCDRVFVGALLHDSIRDIRLKLGQRYVGADRERPFTAVFPNNLEEYVSAKVGEQIDRTRMLCARLTENLEGDDPLIRVAVPELRAQLAAWTEALTAVSEAREVLDGAKARLAQAIVTWRARTLEVYGLLLGRVGKQKAERFFPRTSAKKPRVKAPSAPSLAEPDDGY